jgi:hypothetical protein
LSEDEYHGFSAGLCVIVQWNSRDGLSPAIDTKYMNTASTYSHQCYKKEEIQRQLVAGISVIGVSG